MRNEKDFIIPEQTVNTVGMSHDEYMRYRGFSRPKTVTSPDGSTKRIMKCNLYQHFMTSEGGERRVNQKALDMWKEMGVDSKDIVISAEWDW